MIVGASGSDNDGAIAGLVTSKSSKCVRNRTVKLLGDGELLDTGTTSRGGAWALHVTAAEDQSITQYKIKLSAAKLTNGTRCGDDSAIFST